MKRGSFLRPAGSKRHPSGCRAQSLRFVKASKLEQGGDHAGHSPAKELPYTICKRLQSKGLDCDLGGAKAFVMIRIVDHTKLSGGDTMDRGVGMDGEGIGSRLLQRAGEVLRSMSDLEGDRETR